MRPNQRPYETVQIVIVNTTDDVISTSTVGTTDPFVDDFYAPGTEI